MCLAVPGRIATLIDEEPLTRRGQVDFGGVVKEVNLAFVPEAEVGDYVLVHVGFAVSRIDPDEAARVLWYLQELEEQASERQGEDHEPAGEPDATGPGASEENA